MCAPGGAAATAKGIGTIGDRQSENCGGQVGRFGGFGAIFRLQCMQLLELKPGKSLLRMVAHMNK